MRVCYFGSYDPEYPRNKIIREGLALNGVEVVECHVPLEVGKGLYRRNRDLVQKWRTLGHSHFDAIILAEFDYKNLPLARLLAWQARTPLVFDPLVSYFNTHIEDGGRGKPASIRGLRAYIIDLFSFRWPDLILADTQEHGRYFVNRWGADEHKVCTVYLGADDARFRISERSEALPAPLLLFFGSYVPLHGADTIVKAYAELNPAQRRALRFVMIGRGQTFTAVQALAQRLGLADIEFLPEASKDEIVGWARQASICLGIFGTTAKAQRVIPHKVFESLASGKPVITEDSPAIRELFTNGEHLVTVPCGDEQALARAILDLVGDPAAAAALGRTGGALINSGYTRQGIGRQALNAISNVMHA